MQLFLCEKPSQAKDIARVLGISKREQGFISGGNIVVTGRSAIYSKLPALKPMVSSMAGHGVPMSCLCCLRHRKWSSRSRQNRSSLLSVSCSKGL